MHLLGTKLAFERLAPDEAPHHGWRELHNSMAGWRSHGARTALAARSPGLFFLAETLQGPVSEAAAKIAAVREFLKHGGEWEQGSGGSAAAGVHSMTPKSLGISGDRLGGMGTFNALASMSMKPTLATGMYGGWGGGDASSVIGAYQTMGAGGGAVGW